MNNLKVKCANFEISNDKPFTLIAGPCQLENEAHAIKISTELKRITSELGINLIYKTSFDKARLKSGLDDVRFHDLRHTFASRLVQGGVPLYDVMHMTGHKSLEMVQRYAHLAPEFQSKSIKVLDQFSHNMGTVDKPRLRVV